MHVIRTTPDARAAQETNIAEAIRLHCVGLDIQQSGVDKATTAALESFRNGGSPAHAVHLGKSRANSIAWGEV